MTEEDRERVKKGRAQADAVMRELRGPDAAVKDRAMRLVSSSGQERIGFVLGSAKRLREFLIEAEWRAAALRDLQASFHAPDEDGYADEIECTVDLLAETFDSFRDYVLFGRGQPLIHWEPQVDLFRLGASASEMKRRLAANDCKVEAERVVRRIDELVAQVAIAGPTDLQRFTSELEKFVVELERRAAAAERPAP